MAEGMGPKRNTWQRERMVGSSQSSTAPAGTRKALIPLSVRAVAVMTLVNFRGIGESVKLNVGLTAIELTGLVLVVVIGAAALLSGEGEPRHVYLTDFGLSKRVAADSEATRTGMVLGTLLVIVINEPTPMGASFASARWSAWARPA